MTFSLDIAYSVTEFFLRAYLLRLLEVLNHFDIVRLLLRDFGITVKLRLCAASPMSC